MKSLHWSAVRVKEPIITGNTRFNSIHRPFELISLPKSAFPVLSALGSKQDGSGSPSPCRPASAVASDLRIGPLTRLSTYRPWKISEEQIMKFIYSCRFFALLGVSGSLVGSFLCFLKGSLYIASSFMEYFARQGKVISILIEAIDIYLIGTVMLVFGMGLYELFVCNLDVANTSTNRSSLFGLFKLQERPRWLEIKSVNGLKTKVGHVIVMVLLVGLFERSLSVTMTSPQDVLCFAASLLLSSCGLYLLSRLKE